MRKALGWAAVGAVAAAGVLSVSATANAATFPQRHKAPTTLSVRESAPVVRSHHKDTITGKLAEGRKALARESVTVKVVEGRRLVPAGTARTVHRGLHRLWDDPHVQVQLRAVRDSGETR
jgi:hypothetical protein